MIITMDNIRRTICTNLNIFYADLVYLMNSPDVEENAAMDVKESFNDLADSIFVLCCVSSDEQKNFTDMSDEMKKLPRFGEDES